MQSNEAFIETQKEGSQRASELVNMRSGWVACSKRSWKLSKLSPYFALSIISIWLFLSYVNVVLLLSHVRLFATQWIAALQASLSFTSSWRLLKLISIESVITSNHLILCHSLLLLPSIFPSIRVFSNESALHIRKPVYWSFSLSISPSSEY